QNMVRHNPALAEPLREVAVLIADLRPGTVAVLRSGDAWQYLLQRALMRATDPPPRFVAFTDHPLRRGHRALDPPDLAVGMSNDAYLIPHPDSGATFVALEHRGPYVVHLRADLAESYQARRPDGPAFGGWSSDEGLAPAAGPSPEKGLPRVRWGLWPRTTLRFESDGRPTRLALEARRNPRPDQGMTISLNGRVVARHAFGKPD